LVENWIWKYHRNWWKDERRNFPWQGDLIDSRLDAAIYHFIFDLDVRIHEGIRRLLLNGRWLVGLALKCRKGA
jgi:hypothetical protein